MRTGADYLVKLLETWGVRHIFGIPGVHTVELYRGLEHSSLIHITPRHEQGAGFMADGYARVSGKPGVCWIITGPGMTNILTAMAQAYADSIPMLVISSVNESQRLGRPNGYLHALNNQQALVSEVSAWSHTVTDLASLPEMIGRAFQLFSTERPRPVHIQIPIDILSLPVPKELPIPKPTQFFKPAPSTEAVQAIIERLSQAKRPLILAGGGCIDAKDQLKQLAEYLDAPTLVSINAKGVLAPTHPLNLGANASWKPVRALIAQADVILALGTELGETDYDVLFNQELRLQGQLIRVDIDPRQLMGEYHADIGVVADTKQTLIAVLDALMAGPPRHTDHSGERQVASTLAALDFSDIEWKTSQAFFEVIFNALPDARIVGDSTQPVYFGNHLLGMHYTRSWFNSATGYGTLGYGLPAAIGAKIADPTRPVICLIGDGGVQFTISELATAVEANQEIIVIIWNNHGYKEIKRAMLNRQVEPVGVDIFTPDFQAIAHGFGCEHHLVSSLSMLPTLLSPPLEGKPRVIEIQESLLLTEVKKMTD